MSAPVHIDWDAVADLGTVPDNAIARRLGVTPAAVHYARTKRGIPRAPGKARAVVAADPDLGKVVDRVIAERHGVARAYVRRLRAELGIPPRCEQFDFDGQPLGQEPDGVIAERLGCTREAVHYARKRRGIPPARGGR